MAKTGAADPQRASQFVSVLNLVNNVVGAGLFSMPWVLKQSSIVTGVVLLLFMAGLNGVSFVLLAKCCDLTGSFSYFDMGKMAFGPRFGVLVQVPRPLLAPTTAAAPDTPPRSSASGFTLLGRASRTWCSSASSCAGKRAFSQRWLPTLCSRTVSGGAR